MHIDKFRLLNAIGLILVSAVLCNAFYGQFVGGDLPCPLCLLQRVALVAVLYGLLLNVVYGAKPLHYSLILISAFLGAAIAMRQVLLHIIPGTPPYGAPFLGYHYYTWSFVVFSLVILGTGVISAFSIQYSKGSYVSFKYQQWFCKLAIGIALLVTLGNALSAFIECGLSECPENPVSYKLLSPP
ncbi:MAG: disulfide bond formation protein B [Halioglobus sp.]|nr:disulfide bond formation protein B [Halioglobus sp.]